MQTGEFNPVYRLGGSIRMEVAYKQKERSGVRNLSRQHHPMLSVSEEQLQISLPPRRRFFEEFILADG
jgi:hypothetical protein